MEDLGLAREIGPAEINLLCFSGDSDKDGKVVEAVDGVVSKTVVEHPDPAEQSCIVTLQLVRTQMEDAGKFTLTATNKSGSDQVDLDLIVLDDVPVCDCDMFLNGSLECTCNNRFRAEEGDKVIRKNKKHV